MVHGTQDVAILNTLIATLLDSVDGYEKSADDITNRQLADKFEDRASERRDAIVGLQDAVARAGGEPEDDGTLLASAHRAFLSLREAVTGADDKEIVAEIERGEDYLKQKFETALADDDLSPTAREEVQLAWESVREGHDEMRALRDSLTAFPTD